MHNHRAAHTTDQEESQKITSGLARGEGEWKTGRDPFFANASAIGRCGPWHEKGVVGGAKERLMGGRGFVSCSVIKKARLLQDSLC